VKAEPIWTPNEKRVHDSNLFQFMQFLGNEEGRPFNRYAELYDWSVNQPADFWGAFYRFLPHQIGQEPTSILKGDDIREASWFEGARLNFAEQLLRRRDSQPAIIYQHENGTSETLSFETLYDSVARMASYLKGLGVEKGDRVAGLISNRPEAIIAMLAAASIGAIWSSCSPDFGFQGVLDRFGQIKPKVLIAVAHYDYNGTQFNIENSLLQVLEGLPGLKQLILVNEPHGNALNSAVMWSTCMENTLQTLHFEQLPFDHPLYIMYSSGTTGKPKCMVHGAGGTLFQHLKELVLHTDLKPDDRITYFTTCGWMMWNWLVSSLAVGATVVLYDGSPSFPNLGCLFDMIDRHQINIFGTSPKFLSACESDGLRPKDHWNLSSLRTILSTGSPLSDANFEYTYNCIKEDIQLASISGGTDIISCFMLGNPILPVYKGELQSRGLGMKVETFNDRGEPVENEVGELVCSAPFPSRPVGFWNDEDGSQYHNAYFNHFPGVWRHGDYVKILPHGGCIVYGRSDATLNPGGIRIGTAEIYGPVEALPEIAEALVIGRKTGSDTEIVLFVVPKIGFRLDSALEKKIRSTLRKERSPRHVPAAIHAVPEIPRTISGKKVELAVTRLIHGQPITNRDALKNPDSLEHFMPYKQEEPS